MISHGPGQPHAAHQTVHRPLQDGRQSAHDTYVLCMYVCMYVCMYYVCMKQSLYLLFIV